MYIDSCIHESSSDVLCMQPPATRAPVIEEKEDEDQQEAEEAQHGGKGGEESVEGDTIDPCEFERQPLHGWSSSFLNVHAGNVWIPATSRGLSFVMIIFFCTRTRTCTRARTNACLHTLYARAHAESRTNAYKQVVMMYLCAQN